MSTPNHLFTAMFAQHYQWLRSRVSRTLGCRFRADDVAADTFVRVLRMDDLSTIREPKTLLSTIAKRLIIDSWRREDIERAFLASLAAEPHNTIVDPEEHAQVMQYIVALDKALSAVSRQAKQAFVLSLFDGLTYEQIGRALGISKSRVHQHMEKAYMAAFQVMPHE
ncbi:MULTISPECIES: sigma-70 family RNA polymerase sigma factor [Pseudomonas]|uniref:sigma-70 family RNA polymerase sigma factor n=1 Tax=Pseudomonas TaxID=286 RepID=UPI000EFB7419|nr:MULTISPECIES: sigma-70 family RNA polymerase sigma factor [Pseudomonas]AYO00065.1 sigma-70 family RNA polymerase sigma factor [Pseudomonas sp. LTGT-11-2Z]MCE0876936.1 sigma-70 family RNA polymerase sigma factor [Pseudomonas monteilii]MCE0981596.1 sigma-70 family RNA polymerase sigma factor [Pseudomonas monteilii]MCE1044100.1 sigma-70 family RNA polymerase sigma factor [Pseudomonas monteilii]MCT8192074.1 sigma-70 family RNA polymerase sigma factor [Pseudomonas monteilii]